MWTAASKEQTSRSEAGRCGARVGCESEGRIEQEGRLLRRRKMEPKKNPSPQRRLAPESRASRHAAGQDEVGAADAPEGAISAGMPRRIAKWQ